MEKTDLIVDVRSPNSCYIKFPDGSFLYVDAGVKGEMNVSMWDKDTPTYSNEFHLIFNRDEPQKSTLDIPEHWEKSAISEDNTAQDDLREMRVVDTTGVKGMKEFMIQARARLNLFQAMFPEPETQKYIWSGPDDVDPEKKTVQ